MSKTSKDLADKLFPEDKSGLELAVIDIPPEKRRLHTETYDFSVSTIKDYIDKGNIFIPSFQRGYVWTKNQASRLIESLIIQCPIPVIYLNQERDEKLSVIDGNQRLTSIKLFLEDAFELKGLTAYPELEGNKFSDLDPRIKRHIQNRTLRCIAILKETHPQIKFDVFERLNTGAVQLNQQELRHGIYHGELVALIDELSKEKIWKEISGIKNDTRMKGAELILRFFALYSNMRSYKKPMSTFLTNFCEASCNINQNEKLALKNKFLSTLEKINILFGNLAFRTIDKNLNATGNFNAALYDAQMVAIANSDPTLEKLKKLDTDKFLLKFHELINEDQFKTSIEAGTSATSSVRYRIDALTKFIAEQV